MASTLSDSPFPDVGAGPWEPVVRKERFGWRGHLTNGYFDRGPGYVGLVIGWWRPTRRGLDKLLARKASEL